MKNAVMWERKSTQGRRRRKAGCCVLLAQRMPGAEMNFPSHAPGEIDAIAQKRDMLIFAEEDATRLPPRSLQRL